jgi:tetratricopeptide (TPR) repeat protein
MVCALVNFSNYCNALYNIYEYDEGIKYCNQAIEVDPEHSWSYYVLAEIYKRTGDSEKSQNYQNLYKSMTKN